MGLNSCTPEVYAAHAPLIASTRNTGSVIQSGKCLVSPRSAKGSNK